MKRRTIPKEKPNWIDISKLRQTDIPDTSPEAPKADDAPAVEKQNLETIDIFRKKDQPHPLPLIMKFGELKAWLKIVVLLPVWLGFLPFRNCSEFPHYSWTLRFIGRSDWRRRTYRISLVCWIVFGLVLYQTL